MIFRSFCVLLLVCAPLAAVDPPGSDEWKYDVIYRKHGQPLRGLVLEQGSTIKIRCITRNHGKVSLVFTETVPREEIAGRELLDDGERQRLQQRLDSLKREREVLAAHLRLLGPKKK